MRFVFQDWRLRLRFGIVNEEDPGLRWEEKKGSTSLKVGFQSVISGIEEQIKQRIELMWISVDRSQKSFKTSIFKQKIRRRDRSLFSGSLSINNDLKPWLHCCLRPPIGEDRNPCPIIPWFAQSRPNHVILIINWNVRKDHWVWCNNRFKCPFEWSKSVRGLSYTQGNALHQVTIIMIVINLSISNYVLIDFWQFTLISRVSRMYFGQPPSRRFADPRLANVICSVASVSYFWVTWLRSSRDTGCPINN
jgi:hypothetical protein